ncbi:hypothetical protein DL766_004386 [Monosporascus sp. MC13-8B]|uniref:Epoxide hydrolase N-terminal domain-containing protein n=1 Tax=Monosporascus cannonballus TaxID=155416 RepID=A0ABY0HFX3_9PEZI|nr:hypothetical protein DL762_002035 [Monosporascus cannonballus]RYO97519.1 hypothetical protein DL763_002719 [Monosporascus cannonballus]RYP31411.1 hypothetical protein DL766_004386 [Monosporascus sp. MC13-8B]
MDTRIKPYQIAIPDSAIERLKTKLSLATFPGETTFSNDWKYGAPLDEIKRLAKVWLEKYDWRRAEAELNRLPQFTTTLSVEGHEEALRIHFIHQKSERPNSIPLLFCHGSDLEARLWDTAVCGVTQGGDWGFFVTRAMGILYPSHVLASHINFILALAPSALYSPLLCLRYLIGRYTPAEKAGLRRTRWFYTEGSGYNHMQRSKPHTLGFALADSPVALLAWIYEKLREWTDEYSWTDEEILTWISMYLFSEAGADASIRLYYEAFHQATGAGEGDSALNPLLKWSGIPLGLSYFPKDVIVLPSSWGRTLGPVVFETRHEEGGHFAAYEKPELVVRDLRKMFGKGGIDVRLDG